jgi:RNA polymerase sigma factor (sigma-70 family)
MYMDAESGDFARFYAESRDDCLRTVLASIGDLDRAKDLVDEAFARAWASWRKVRRHPAPRAWIVRTALNVGISTWRRRHEVQFSETVCPADATSGSVVDRDIMAALRRLPERQRQVIALRLFLDLDTAGTAEVLGIAPGTVTARSRRGGRLGLRGHCRGACRASMARVRPGLRPSARGLDRDLSTVAMNGGHQVTGSRASPPASVSRLNVSADAVARSVAGPQYLLHSRGNQGRFPAERLPLAGLGQQQGPGADGGDRGLAPG